MNNQALKILTEHQMYAWNTGAFYTECGQRIAAILLPNQHAYFHDIDRGIDGTTVMPITGQYVNLKEFVTHAYDFCHYVGGPYKMKDWFVHLGWEGMDDIKKAVESAAFSVGREKTWSAVHVPFEAARDGQE